MPDVTQQNGRALITMERERQQSQEDYSAGHDDEHIDGELSRAANCYFDLGNGSLGIWAPDADQSDAGVPEGWPWGEDWWNPKSRLRNLVRAGALYQAEIDRLSRKRSETADYIDKLLNGQAP